MHILLVSKACLVGTYQRKLEHIAAADDVELTVAVPPTWDDPAGRILLEHSHTSGYNLVIEPIRFNGHYHFHYYPALGKRIKAIQPDVLHMDEEPYNLATWLAVRQAKKSGCKTLFFSWQNLYNHYPFPFGQMEKSVLNMVDYAIVGNEASGKIWQQKGYSGPVAHIPQFGVDTQLFTPPSSRDTGRSFVIGAAGRRLVPEKGLDTLLNAAAGLPGVWRLQIAGEGPEREPLTQLAASLGITDRVVFDGVVSSEQMPAYLQQFDTLVLPSRTTSTWKEQFGRVLIEAMACGVPVIGANSGEIPNVIGDAGLIFIEDDVPALQTHLMNLMQNPSQWGQLSKAGRQRVLAHYTQEQIAAQTVAVYRKMTV